MEKNELIELLCKKNDVIYFTRNMMINSHPGTLLNIINDLTNEYPEARNVIISFMVHPGCKWCLERNDAVQFGAEPIDDNIYKILCQTQKALLQYGVNNNRMQMKQRNECLLLTRKIVELVERSVASFCAAKGQIKKKHDVLYYSHIEPSSENGPSKHLYATYYKQAICDVVERFGTEFDDLYRQIDTMTQGTAEMQVLYHNTNLLLFEYKQIINRNDLQRDKALQLLNFTNIDKMLAVTDVEKNFEQAITIIDFIKFIHKAIEQVKYFPVHGQMYYDILSYCYRKTPNTREVSSLELAEYINKSARTAWGAKKTAIAILSLFLWGCTTKDFLALITD